MLNLKYILNGTLISVEVGALLTPLPNLNFLNRPICSALFFYDNGCRVSWWTKDEHFDCEFRVCNLVELKREGCVYVVGWVFNSRLDSCVLMLYPSAFA
jgi:hypothetical protein